VVTDSMGPKELVHHGTTGYVAHDDPHFVRAVDVLVRDVELRKTMGAAARRFAETRSWDAIFAQLLQYYDQTIAARLSQGSPAGPAWGREAHV
jgi:glycosyltransferase involved in cell wall biosynthesis